MGQSDYIVAGTGQTFTVPAAVKNIDTLVVIGGGGGGGFGGDGSGGGAGGYATFINISVSPGQTITFDVGAGGAAETNGTDSTATIPSVGTLIGHAGNAASGNTPGTGGTHGGTATAT